MATLLDSIQTPDDIKKLALHQLPQLCREIRHYITRCCAHNPGHFGASLGTVELTVALHYVFHCPEDKIIWDVGHQAYTHKILTGRKEAFVQNRCYGGISGFPRREESPYDAFGTGHASTSISAALGMAAAAALQGDKNQIVAVIGDGAMTGGLAYEGLNNAGSSKTNMLVILNDNQMSIAPNVGGMHNYLLKLTTSARYNRLKKHAWEKLGPSGFRNLIQRTVKTTKRFFLGESTLFQSMGLRYFGPADGHDVMALVGTLRRLKDIEGPKLLHILTIKGKGFKPAEEDQPTWHAPGTFDAHTGKRTASGSGKTLKFQNVFGQTILALAKENKNIVGITAAMPGGTSLDVMMQEMPHRCFDVGIAEAHAVTFAAGLAASGALPYCVIYSSFMQRAYDSVIHDVALQRLKVVFCLDRSGLVGEDGPTHHGAFDLAAFRCIPNLTICAPMDEQALRDMMYSAQNEAYGPVIIRYPRGSGRGRVDEHIPYKYISPGTGRCISEEGEVAVLSIGAIGLTAAKGVASASEETGKAVAHYDMQFLKPLDETLLERICNRHKTLVTIEDGCVMGGLHAAVAEYLAKHGKSCRLTGLGIPDRFVPHGTVRQLFEDCGYDAESVKALLCRELKLHS